MPNGTVVKGRVPMHTLIRLLRAGVRNSAPEDQNTPSPNRARARMLSLVETFVETFRPEDTQPLFLCSAPGRTEIGGNHTDHQNGRVLCAAVDCDLLACAMPNGLPTVRLHSEGYAPVEIDLRDLRPNEAEFNTTAALVRGVAAGIRNAGFPIGGFDICVTSDIPVGAGLSSSAAFEVLIGKLFNRMFCRDQLTPTQLAQIGQFAEQVYFGKPCGLMDQMACSLGGILSIDFADPAQPAVESVSCDLAKLGYTLCIINTGSCHADLTEDYAAIPREMGQIAAHFGAKVLRDVAEEDVRAQIPALRAAYGDRAVLRALHFYEENRRADIQADALSMDDLPAFLRLVNESGASSVLSLQNIHTSNPAEQSLTLALTLGRAFLGSEGAIRVHGGGFAGTVQAFVPTDLLPQFKEGMEAVFGAGSCLCLRFRTAGACILAGG